jgi:hypothetical protein
MEMLRRKLTGTYDIPKWSKPRQPQLQKRRPTNARTCECGETVFVYTSLVWIAIVDAEDGWLLRDYKWTARGYSLDGIFCVASNTYHRDTGNSSLLHQAVTGHIYPQLDHINRNDHDCRKINLRPCTYAQNKQNQKKHRGLGRYKGVYRTANRWRAKITIDGNHIHLGYFGFESDAAIAYNYHAAHLFGEFAKLNQIPIEEYMHD